MLSIPPEYKDTYISSPCVPINSKYGKFLVKYKTIKKIKKSKIQAELDSDKPPNFSGISKYDFLNTYLLNDKYILDDFLNIKNHSLRGFLYETIWDICIKCNTVSLFRDNIYDHIEGKIEKPDTLNTINNMYKYFIENKLISSNNAGISDITLKQNNHYIVISCKHYTLEKSVFKTDIHKIQTIFQNKITKKNNTITHHNVLCIKNKISFNYMKSKTQKEKRELFDELIYAILDETDLRKSLLCLRQFYKIININKNGMDTYLINKPDRPLFIPLLHTYLFTNILQSWLYKLTETKKIFNCCINNILYQGIFLFLLLNTNKKIQILCNKIDNKQLLDMSTYYYIPIKFNVKYSKYDDKIDPDTNIVLFLGSSKDMDIFHNSISCPCFYIINELIDNIKENTEIVSFQIENILSWKNDNIVSWNPTNILEQAILQYYGKNAYNIYLSTLENETIYDIKQAYNIYPDVIAELCHGDNLQKQIESIFGTKQDHQNIKWIYNKLKKNNASYGSGIHWITDTIDKDILKGILNKNEMYKYILQSNFKNNEVITDFTNIINMNLNCSWIICLTNKISFPDIYKYLSECFTKIETKYTIVLLNNNIEIVTNIQNRLNYNISIRN